MIKKNAEEENTFLNLPEGLRDYLVKEKKVMLPSTSQKNGESQGEKYV